LRKGGATIAAENGATSQQLMAIFGWSSLKMAELYARAADQKATRWKRYAHARSERTKQHRIVSHQSAEWDFFRKRAKRDQLQI
jgi:hypothetical protein